METLVNVGAPRRLTNSVQIETAKIRLQGVQGFKMRRALARPSGQARTS